MNASDPILFRASTRGGRYEVTVTQTSADHYRAEWRTGGHMSGCSVRETLAEIRAAVDSAIDGALSIDGHRYITRRAWQGAA